MQKAFLRNLIFFIFVVFIILICELGALIPSGLQEVDLYFIKIKNDMYPDLNSAYWVVCMKLITILVCVVWYRTCAYWWRIAILTPLIIEIYKLYEALDFSERYMDNWNFIDSLPFTIPLLLGVGYVLYYKWAYLNSRLKLRAVDKEINKLINEQVEVNSINKFRVKLEELLRKKESLTREEYLSRLNVMKSELKSI